MVLDPKRSLMPLFCVNEPMQTNALNTPDTLMDQLSIARQPIVDANRAVVAYELFNRLQSASVSSDVSFSLHALAESGAPFAITN